MTVIILILKNSRSSDELIALNPVNTTDFWCQNSQD